MKNISGIFNEDEERLYDCVSCFGEFNPKNKMCKHTCGLNIRCAIERDLMAKDEILQDLFDVEVYQQQMQ